MTTIAPERAETAIRPGYNGFLEFAELIGLPLEPYMRRIARAYFRGRGVGAVRPHRVDGPGRGWLVRLEVGDPPPIGRPGG